MTHSMIANDNRTVTSSAFRFNPMVPSLGTTVKDILSKLTYGSICSGPTGGVTPSPSSSGYVSQPGSMLSQPSSQISKTLPPQDMIAFEGLTEEQIRKMLADKSEMEKFVDSLSSIVGLKKTLKEHLYN
eukprot:gnl/Chilomastix_caulleri/1612.p1 GENE.gnl/Chilomastix_caulleri/1612~~gnl/Chilomastix_caulleri/1612.p1  ORF type:complete len:129 (+),score=23.73 gnl/Chilomastix_caulleri/1612:132-518(+)